MAREMGLMMREKPYSLTEFIEIMGYFAEQKQLRLLAETEKILLSAKVDSVH